MRRFPSRSSLRLSFAALLLATACTRGTNGPAALPAVSAALPPVLPAWIASYGPSRTAHSLSQIRVIFAKPVVPLSALENPRTTDVLSHFTIEPHLRGDFVLLTPRMVGFVAEQALPLATRVRITLTAGLRDLTGDSLQQNLAWSFHTQVLEFTDLPTLHPAQYEPAPAPQRLHPTFAITSNAEVDVASLAAHTRFAPMNGDPSIPATAKLQAQPTPPPGFGAAQRFDPSLNRWVYLLAPAQRLAKSTRYTLTIDPGVTPASGNLASGYVFSGSFTTYTPLAIVGITPLPYETTRFANLRTAVLFNNPIDPKSLPNAISVSPAPAKGKELFALSDGSRSVDINPYLLNPNTAYTITVNPNLADTFGQKFGRTQTLTLHTGDFTPGFWAPSDRALFPSTLNLDLNVYATNVPHNRYRAEYRVLSPQDLVGIDYAGSEMLPKSSTWSLRPIAHAQTNVQSIIRIPLRSKLGGNSGVLAYGVSANLGPQNTQSLYGIVQLTNLGLFAEWFPQSGQVMVQHLNDGSPAAYAQIEVYRDAGPPCAQGVADATGLLRIDGGDIDRCYIGNRRADEAPTLVVVAREGSDWAYVRTGSYSGIYRYDVTGGWSEGQPRSRGTIFSDRQMYQPGETGWFTGVAYTVQNDDLHAERNAPYRVTLTDPSGAKTSLGTQTSNAYGTFSLKLTLAKNQPLGYYSISAIGASGNTINGAFRVAQFKPPNFKVDLALDRPYATAGDTLTATGTASYLFGGALDGGKTHIYVTRDVATIAPKGWDTYSFGPQWFWPEQQPAFTTDVSQTDLTLDKQGIGSQAIAIPANLPFAMTYTVDFATTDVSNLSVSSTQTFTAYPRRAQIGVKSDYVGQAGTPLPVQLIVTDPAGKVMSGRALHVELQKMTYAAATQLVEGGDQAQNAVQYTTVDSADATSASTPTTIKLNADAAGSYRIRANFSGAANAATAGETQVWFSGAGTVAWASRDPSVLHLKLDKRSYKVGDTARVIVQSPYAQGDLYLSVVRENVLYRRIVPVTGSAPRISFTVTPQMRPNVAVQAVLVRRGTSLPDIKGGSHGSPDSLDRIGMVPLTVSIEDRYLKLAITPKAATVQPGSAQTVSFHLSDTAGKAVRGEVVVMVVNDAILQLSGYRPPDLAQTVFAPQSISARLADNRQNVILRTERAPMAKGWGYGGGFMAGAAGTRVRTHFAPLAYYNGSVLTDTHGNASVTFTLPDDLTAWRVMALAIGNDDRRFARSDATFMTTQPLLTDALLPQFARPGDIIDGGLSIRNDTKRPGSLRLSIALTGALVFDTGRNQALQRVITVNPGMQAIRFPMLVGTPAPTRLQFTSKLGSQSDAFAVPLSIRTLSQPEASIESGATRKQLSLPIDLSYGGNLDITLARSVTPQLLAPIKLVMAAPRWPLLESSASRLTIASAMLSLKPADARKLGFDPIKESARYLAAILRLQLSDGGFAAFPGAGVSDPFGSPYAAESLGFARADGIRVDGATISRLVAYLATSLNNPAHQPWCSGALCQAQLRLADLRGLAALGDRRNDFLADIYAIRTQLDTATQLRLARYLLQTPGWRMQGHALAQTLMQTVYLTGRYANANVPQGWLWFDSTVETQAQMLQLAVQQHAGDTILDGAARGLIAQSCACGWPSTYDTAEAVKALVAYTRFEPSNASLSASVSAGGKTLATLNPGVAAQTLTLPASAIGANALILQAHHGVLHYTLTYRYNLPSDAPGALAGLRVIRIVRSPGATDVAARMDLAALGSPISLAPGHVFLVTLRIIADHPVDHVMITDPLPAGLEAVDSTFRTTPAALIPQSQSWAIDYQTIYSDRVQAYAGALGPGVYDLQYLVRSVTPGTYAWPGATVRLQYAPEQFGRTAAAQLIVQ